MTTPETDFGFDKYAKRGKKKEESITNENLPRKFSKNFSPGPKDLASVVLPGRNTAKIRALFQRTIELDGDIVQAAMDVGYRASSINHTGKIMSSGAWQKLVEVYFPTVVLFEKDRDLLNHPDWRANNAALERIHKLKGNFIRKIQLSVDKSGGMGEKSNEDLVAIASGESVIDGEGEEDEYVESESTEDSEGEETPGEERISKA